MWLEYERWKRLLRALNLTPEEYEKIINEYWRRQDEAMGKTSKTITT